MSQALSKTRTLQTTRILAVLLIPVLLYLSFVAAKTLLSDLYFSRANRALNQWAAGRKVPSVKQWMLVRDVMDDALDLDPGNPRILDSLGRLNRWASAVQAMPNDQRSALRAQASDYFRTSISRRPTSPFTWANIALEKYALAQYDEQFEHSLRMAVYFGPWIGASQSVVANAGLGAWALLSDEETGMAVRDAVIRGLTWPATHPGRQRHADNIWKIVAHYDRQDVVCGWLPDSPGITERCQDADQEDVSNVR